MEVHYQSNAEHGKKNWMIIETILNIIKTVLQLN